VPSKLGRLGVDDHLDAELARVRSAQQIAVGGVLAFAAGLVQVSPADVDQGERAGQWINGPHLCRRPTRPWAR